MNKVLGFLGNLLLFVLAVHFVWLYGRTWEFGPHGLPVSILSPDGATYRDGSEIDPVSAAIIRSGMEEPFWAACVALMACAAYEWRRRKYLSELRSRRKQTNALLALSKRYEQAGRWQEAQRAFDAFRQSVEAEMALWLKRRSTRRLLETAWKDTHKANSDSAAHAGRE